MTRKSSDADANTLENKKMFQMGAAYIPEKNNAKFNKNTYSPVEFHSKQLTQPV